MDQEACAHDRVECKQNHLTMVQKIWISIILTDKEKGGVHVIHTNHCQYHM